MSVLKGEGKVPILFGSTTIAVASRTHGGYLARPDLAGEWPTIVLVGSAWGATSNVKDIARRFARQGFAVVAPDVHHGAAPSRTTSTDEASKAAPSPHRVAADLADIVAFVQNPSGFWSSAEHGFGVLGLGTGGRAAALSATSLGASALGLVTSPLDGMADALAGFDGAVLGLFGRDDSRIDPDDVAALRDAVPQAEFVIYSAVAGEFMDDYLESYDDGAAADAIERLTEMFEKQLPPQPA